jgi:hypothetical protein
MTPPVRLRTGESSRPVIFGFGTRRIWRGLLRVGCAIGTWGGRSSDRPAVDDSTVGRLSALSADGLSGFIGAPSLSNDSGTIDIVLAALFHAQPPINAGATGRAALTRGRDLCEAGHHRTRSMLKPSPRLQPQCEILDDKSGAVDGLAAVKRATRLEAWADFSLARAIAR